MPMQAVQPLLTGLLQLFAVGILSLLLQQRFDAGTRPCILLFCFLFLFDSLAVRLLNADVFAGQNWNWVGKAASVLWAVVFLYQNKVLSKAETGWTWTVKHRKSVFATIAVLLALRLALRFWFGGFGGAYNLETFCYQATLPGLSEEIVYRGVLLGLLNKTFPPTWYLWKARLGWGLVLTAVLFGLVHSLSFDGHWAIAFSLQRFLMTGALGFVLGFLKEKAQSLVPAVLFHNCWNVIVYWGK